MTTQDILFTVIIVASLMSMAFNAVGSYLQWKRRAAKS